MPSDDRTIDLESRIAFQERALDELNRVVADQQLELDRLVGEVKDLRRRVTAGDAGGQGEERTLEDDRPPHY